MLRRIRLLGMIVFAWLAVFGADDLFAMYKSGELFKPYSSRRKSTITLFAVSVCALSALSYYELSRIRLRSRYEMDYNPYRGAMKKDVPGEVSSSIYDAPSTREDWDGSEMRVVNLDDMVKRESPEIWMNWLRICSLLMPIIYSGLFAIGLYNSKGQADTVWMLSGIFVPVFLFSIITVVGIFRRAPWGMSLGFLLAIGNFLIFPYGTMLGLFLLIGLVGAKSLFSEEQRLRKKIARRKARRKARAKRGRNTAPRRRTSLS